MKHAHLVFAFMASVMLPCCTTHVKKSNLQTLTVSMSDIQETASLKEFATQTSYIPLETNDSTLISRISDIKKKDHLYYISDESTLYKFNKEGKLVGKISKKGTGPDEYTNISDFQIDKDGNVWVLNRNQKRLNLYSWEGTLLKQIHLKYWVEKISFHDDSYIYMFGGNVLEEGKDSKIQVFDMNTEQYTAHFLPIDKNQSNYLHILGQQCFDKQNEGTYFYQLFNDTIYKLTPQSIEPYICVNLDNKNIPASFYERKYENVMFFFNALHKESYAYGISYFHEYLSRYLFSFIYQQRQYLAVLPKSGEEKAIIVPQLTVGDNLLPDDFLLDLIETQTFLQDEGSLIFVLPASQITEYAETKGNIELTQRLQILDSEQNPILLDVEIK